MVEVTLKKEGFLFYYHHVDPTVEEPSVFVLEKYLEDFLVSNWESTELGKSYDIYQDENGTGQQYQTDSGRIDILAVSKDGKELLVVELKKGRASDAVVGQITRYMGYVTTELAGPGQKVKGVIVALEDDQRLRHSLVIVPGIDFYRYEVSFKLTKI
jgi:restriction system protein